jgi:hypothetical protein
VKHHHISRELIQQTPGATLAFNDKPRSNMSNAMYSTEASKSLDSTNSGGVQLDGDNNPVRPPAKPVTRLAAARESFVVIKPNQDASTGLDTAQEVTDKSDVLVGG